MTQLAPVCRCDMGGCFSARVSIVVTLDAAAAYSRVIDGAADPRYCCMASVAFRSRGNMAGRFSACADPIVATRAHTRDLSVVD